MELVSGWSTDDRVFLVTRDGDEVQCKSLPARWSAFFQGLNDEDVTTLGRNRDVVSVKEDGRYIRVDFKNRWARKNVVDKVNQAIEARREVGWRDPEDDTPDAAVLEADVTPLRRLLSDSPALQIATSPRLAYLDLETDSRRSIQEAREGKARILCWSVEADGELHKDVLEADTNEAEAALLSRLFQLLHRWDVILAWNGYDFDFPALEQRMVRLKVQLPNGRQPEWRRWCWLDHMLVFKKYNQAHESGEERSSFGLNNVAQHLLGYGKHDFDAKYTWKAWAAGGEERQKLVDYCGQDTKLMPAIEAKTGFVSLHLAVCHVTRCFPDTDSLSATQQGDGFLLSLGAQHGFRFPTKPYFDEQQEGFAGAYVMAPTMLGVIDNVHVADYAGLYPSIMRSWNMSLDTLVPRHRRESTTLKKCKLPEQPIFFRTDRRGIIPMALDQLVAQRAEYTKKADAAQPGSDEWNFFKRLSSAFKIIANSFYGIVGSPFSRFFNKEIAQGVTQTGAWLIKHVAASAARVGLKPFYGDTDSIFVTGKSEVFAELVKTLNASWAGLLAGFGCTRSELKLEFEKSFARLLLKSAKCYAGRYSMHKGKPAPADMKPEVRGLEYKRGDAIRLAREMQYQFIQKVLPPVLPPPPLPPVEEFRTFVEEWRARLLAGELKLGDVMMSKSVKDLDEYKKRYTNAKCGGKVEVARRQYSGPAANAGPKELKPCAFEFGGTDVGEGFPDTCPKCGTERKLVAPPVHVRVAHLLEERGESVTPGTRIEYIIAKPPEGLGDGKQYAIPAMDEGALEKLDRDHYWDKLVYPPTERLLEVTFPDFEWRDTASRRRKATAAEEKARLMEERRNKVDDLPLFGAPTNEVQPLLAVGEVSTRVESQPLPVAGRVRRRQPAALQAREEDSGEPVVVHIRVQGEEDKEDLLKAIQAAVEAHPGPAALKVRLEMSDLGVAMVKTPLKVSRERKLRFALERLGARVEGAGA